MAKAATPVPVAAATTTVAGKTRELPVITAVSTAIPIPQRSAYRGSKSSYDFSILAVVGASFGVKNKTLKQINPIVNRENKRNCTEVLDPTNPGKTIKMYSARYEAFEVDATTDPDGAKVRVFRVE